MIQYSNILAIAKKEFATYFNTSTGYILIVPFLVISFFLYFRSAFIANQASLRPFFDLLPFMLLLFAPAIAMRTFAQEQKNKTLELLYAHPISEVEIVVGKFLGSFGYFAILLLSTFSLPLTTLVFSNPDPGVILAQYLGGLFVGGAFLSIGIAAATFTATQVASFLLAAAISFGFLLLGFEIVLLGVPTLLAYFVTELALLPHMNSVTRGVLDMRDLLYFLTLIGAFLTMAVIKLSTRKTAEDRGARNRLYLALGLILAIGVVANVLVNVYPFRLDLTFNRLFTLSPGTKQTLQQLPDIVTITLYTSSNLPGPIQVTAREVEDLIWDFQRFSGNRIRFEQRYPDSESDQERQAQEHGIQPVQFNTLANNSFAVASGYFGLTLTYGDKTETIPFIQQTEDLEYQLTRRIRKMTTKIPPTIALFTPPDVQMAQPKSLEILRQNLTTQYEVRSVSLDQAEASVSADTLVLYGLTDTLSATASAHLSDFVKAGGNAVLLLDNHTINPQAGVAQPFTLGVEGLLEEFGVKMNRDLVYDLQLHETITLSNGAIQYLMPYPFWIKALPGGKSFPALSGISSVSLAWPSSFELEVVEGVEHFQLLRTGPRGGSQEGVYTIAPEQIKEESFSDQTEEKLVAVAAQKGQQKLVAVADSDFILDQFTGPNQENLAFASAIIDWVAAEEAIASIPRKVGTNPVFQFDSGFQAQMMQYLNLLLPPVVIGAFAFWWLGRRKRLSRRIYTRT